jgi:WD40 repeat protein
VALAGHTDWVWAVQMSRDGERVVSGSHDGTVRVWSVPRRAAVAAVDVGPPRVVDLRAATLRYDDDFVIALSLAADAATLFVGMGHGGIHVVDCDSGLVEALLRTDRTGAGVICLALVEFNSNLTNCGGGVYGRLFAGHDNGLVSEWDLEARSCVTVYGNARSGVGHVRSIAARIVPAAGEQGVEGDGESKTAGSVVGASLGSRSGAAGGGECVIEFATGYDDGTVRVWRADGCAEGGGEGEAALCAGPLLPENLAVGCTSVPRRHVDIPGNIPSCISASADGRWLVSGSNEGTICVWDVVSGHCVATLLGHGAGNIRCVDISDCGSIVASCSEDTTARVWSLKDGEWSPSTVLQHDERVNCLVLTADGTRAITGDVGGVVRVWNADTGVLCEPVLFGHDAGITTLAVDCSQVTIGDSGRGESIGRTSRSLTDNLKRGPRNQSLRGRLRFSSRDVSGTCFLWNWPREDSVESRSQIPFEQALEQVFVDVLGLTENSRWRQQRYWWLDKPDTFTMRATEANSTGCEVRSDRVTWRKLEVVPCAPRSDGCECVARIELDSVIENSTMYAFERREGGLLKTIACCGLVDGTLALFEVMRPPER